jgi:hypothetical protein
METARYSLARTESEARRHQQPITFYVPDAEAKELIAAAELSGRSLGSYIRSRLFAPPSQTGGAIDEVSLTRLQREMERVSMDIHELLRWVKFGHSPLAEEFRAALSEYRRLAASIRQTLRRKPGRRQR